MRAPTRSTRSAGRRRTRDGVPIGIAAVVLAAAGATVGLMSPAAASPNVQLVVNSAFDSYPWIWECRNVSPSSIPHDHYMQGQPTADDYASCSQQVRVEPNSTYLLSARVRGPFVFVGVTGDGTNAATWSGQSDWNTLATTVTTGPATTLLTVYFHGWYGTGAYDVRSVTLTGPGEEPSPCGTGSGGPSPSATPSCTRTYLP